jgi:ASCH domain
MKALIIDEPWITAILTGEKTWEMRKKSCKIRGQIALIRKGSSHVVGTADVVDSRPPVATPSDYADAHKWHRIPPALQGQAFQDGWRTPWVLANARRLQNAVRYKHPSGAVVWVNLQPDVTAQVKAQVPHA